MGTRKKGRRRSYSPEFKARALEMVARTGISRAAKALGVSPNTIKKWNSPPQGPGLTLPAPGSGEVRFAPVGMAPVFCHVISRDIRKEGELLPANHPEIRYLKRSGLIRHVPQ